MIKLSTEQFVKVPDLAKLYVKYPVEPKEVIFQGERQPVCNEPNIGWRMFQISDEEIVLISDPTNYHLTLMGKQAAVLARRNLRKYAAMYSNNDYGTVGTSLKEEVWNKVPEYISNNPKDCWIDKACTGRAMSGVKATCGSIIQNVALWYNREQIVRSLTMRVVVRKVPRHAVVIIDIEHDGERPETAMELIFPNHEERDVLTSKQMSRNVLNPKCWTV